MMKFKTFVEQDGDTLDVVEEAIRDSYNSNDNDDHYIDYMYDGIFSPICIRVIIYKKTNNISFSKTKYYGRENEITGSICLSNITKDDAVKFLNIAINMYLSGK